MLGCSDCKESAYSAGDPGLIPGPGRFPGEGNGYPLQYSCLENSITEESGRLQSMGSQRVRHDWACTHTYRESPPVQYAHLVPCPEPRILWGFPCGSAGKESVCNAGDPGMIPGSGRSSGEGNGNPLQYSSLANSKDRPWGCKRIRWSWVTNTFSLSFLLSSLYPV